MRRDFWLICIFVATISFFSKTFVDATTYPKLIALSVLLIGLILFSILKKKIKSIFIILILWNLVFLVYLFSFGFDQKINVLLGYPGRNLGMLSLLMGILALHYFKSIHIITSLTLLLISSSAISASYVLAKLVQNPPIILAQFSYPEPGALNQNIITLFISFGVISGLALLSFKPQVGVLHPNLTIALTTFCVITLWRIGDLQASLYLALMIFVTLVLILIRSKRLRNLIFLIPYVALPAINFFAIRNIEFLRDKLSFSVFERLEIASITLKSVSQNSVIFRLPDTTADLEKRTSIQGIEQYIDNAHNVFLELGIHFGWAPMSFFILLIIIVFLMRTIQLNNSQLSKAVKVYSTSCLLIIYTALYLTILHPITILAAAISLSSVFSIKISQKKSSVLRILLFEKRFKGNQKLIDFCNRLQISKKGTQTISTLLLLLPLFLIADDVQQKIKFRQMEVNLISGRVEKEFGIQKLTSMTLTLKDRQYLNYTAKQLAEIGDCKTIREIFLVQEDLKISDFPSFVLRQWHSQNCPYQ